MECADYRKLLKDYALSALTEDKRKLVESHIEKCPVCIRELSMWQDVIERQKELSYRAEEHGLAGKIREAGRKIEKDIYMAPGARRLNYVANTLKSPAGLIIMVITAVIMGLAALFILIKKEMSPAFYVLMITGGLALIFVSIRSFFIRKKKK